MRGFKSKRALDIYHLILAPTHACNLRCKHCYLPDHATNLLPREVALRLVDEWSEIVMRERGRFKGIFHVKGGEPFVTPYLFDLLARMAELKTLWFMMTTNGTFTAPENFDRLDHYNQELSGHLTCVVSVDGASAATHEFLRGEGRFEQTMHFIRELRKRDIQVYMNSVIHQGNIHELDQFVAMAKAMEVAQINFLPLVPKGYGAALRQTQAPHLDIHRALAAIYRNGDEETKRLMVGGLPDIQEEERRDTLAACAECVAGYRGLFYIKPDGSVYSCPNLEQARFAIANVHQDSLNDASDRLWSLHSRLRSAQVDDRYVCSGERIKYEDGGDHFNRESLSNLRNQLSAHRHVAAESAEVAFCVSRNW